MAAEPAPHLSLVDPVDRATGEVIPATIEALAAEVQQTRDEYAQLLRNYKGKCRQLSELERRTEAEAEEDKLWPVAVRVFDYHNRVHGHRRAEWNLKRFKMAARELRKRDGLERCLRAIAGKATDTWAREHGHTTFDDVFETAKKFEKCVARCPSDWSMPAGALELVK